jgi:hypothetical protein
MVDINGSIVIHRQLNQLGDLERIDFEWEGGPVIGISFDLFSYCGKIQGLSGINKNGVLKIGPYRLKFLEERGWEALGIFVRMRGLLWPLIFIKYKLIRPLDLVYRRLIITLAVWGLAELREAVLPGWQDIYAVRKIRAMGKAIKSMKYLRDISKVGGGSNA